MINIYKLYIKSLLRNKTLITTTILIPLILYPLIYWGITQFFMIKAGLNDNHELKTEVVCKIDRYSDFIDSLKSIKNVEIYENKEISDIKNNKSKFPVIIIDSLYSLPHFTIKLDSTNALHLELYNKTKKKMDNYFKLKLGKKIEDSSYSPSFFEVFNLETINISDKNEVMTKLLSIFIPMFAIISILTGASVSAVEITAGEKEDKTAETIFLIPLSRKKIIFSKILVSTSFAFVSGLTNFLILSTVVAQAFNFIFKSMHLSNKIGFDINTVLNFRIISVTLFALLILAFTGSVLFIAITAFAKTKKEANVMLTPALSILMYVSFVVVLPGIKPNLTIALIPVLNLAFAIKLVITQNYNIIFFIEVIISSILFLIILFKLLIPIMEDERIILSMSEEKSMWKMLKSKFKKR